MPSVRQLAPGMASPTTMGAVHGTTTMLRIYDDTQIRRRFTLKRAQMLMLFAGGAVSGLWLANNGGGVAIADAANALHDSGPALTTRWCDAALDTGLRFDCALSAGLVLPAEGS